MSMPINDELYLNLNQVTSQIIDELESIVARYTEVLDRDSIRIYESIRELNDHPFERVRSKMKSQLMNIVVCGEFSSGKSFLISGLIKRITWYETQGKGFMKEAGDGYAPFLPASPRETNSCLLTLQPSQFSDERSHFEVMFDDTKVWENKSEPYKDEAGIRRLMSAYATELDEYRNGRTTQDLSRKVIKARVHIPNMPFPAYVHDLPGIGGTGDEDYLEMVQDAVRQADVVIYIASAIKPLTKSELNLLSFVEDVTKTNKCPVLFVLSQIDREEDYKQVLETNNRFLKENFSKTFSGQTFIPVSAATEAKAQTKYERSQITEAVRNEGIDESGMPILRERLKEYLVNTSGPLHLREIVLRMHHLLENIKLHIDSRVNSLSVPIQDAEKRLQELNQLVVSLINKRESIRRDLEEHGKSVLRQAFSKADSDDLLSLLRHELEPIISNKDKDVLDEKVRHEIEQKKKEIRDRWLYQPGGPEESWSKAFGGYQKQTIILLNSKLEEAIEEAEIKGTSLAEFIRDKTLRSDADFNSSIATTINAASSSWQTLLSLVSLGTAGYTGLAGAGTIVVGGVSIAAAPIAILFLTAGVFGFGWSSWRKRLERQKLRQQIIEQLPIYADEIRKQLELQAGQFIDAYQGEIIEIVNNLIASQQDSITAIRREFLDGNLKQNRDKLDEAIDLQKSCEKLDNKIQNFYSMIPSNLSSLPKI
jgi:GTPase SAR1 family protein